MCCDNGCITEDNGIVYIHRATGASTKAPSARITFRRRRYRPLKPPYLTPPTPCLPTGVWSYDRESRESAIRLQLNGANYASD